MSVDGYLPFSRWWTDTERCRVNCLCDYGGCSEEV